MISDNRTIGAPVGVGQPNDPADVRHVQHLLNRHLAAPGGGRLAEDGTFGPRTQERLAEYQRDTVGLRHPDGIVDPHGPTVRSLSEPAGHRAVVRSEADHRVPGRPAAPGPGRSIQDLVASSGAAKTTGRHPSGGNDHLTHQQYVDEMLPHARAVHEKWGVPVSVMLVQGSVESSWGNRHPDNVYFGVKGYAPDGKSVMLMTHEEVEGERILVPQRFRAYDSLAAAADDYGRFLKSNERYKEAFKHPDDGIAFVKAVAAAGYASDPNYASTLESRMVRHDMLRYDDHSPRQKPDPVLSPLPANRDVADPALATVHADPKDLWRAVAERGRQSLMARQGASSSYDPVAAQVGPSLMRTENDSAIRKDMVGGWQAAMQAGAAAREAQQHQQAAPVAVPSSPRMKP